MTTRARSIVVLFFVITVALFSTSARADLPPRTFRLEVRADGTSCPDVDGMRDALALALRVDPIVGTSPARLVVTLLQAGALARGGWEMFGPEGVKLRERTFTITGSCAQLAKDLALTFAVFYDTPPASESSTCDAACQAKAREDARRELIAEGYRPPMDVHAVVMAGGLLSANLTADPGGGFFLAGEARGKILSGGLEVRVLFPSRAVEDVIGYTFEISSFTAALVPCARYRYFVGCVVFDVGMLVAGGTVAPPLAGPPIVATLGIGPRVAAQIPFAERFGARVFADLRIAPIPSSYNFINTGGRWESEVVSALFGVGLTFE